MNNLVIFVLLVFTSSYYTQNLIYENNSLDVVWGKKNYSGVKDVSGSSKMYSDGKQIILEINVIDDKLVNKEDPLNTDHVEVWFSIPVANEFSNHKCVNTKKYILGSDTTLYLYNQTPDIDGFNNELKHPLILCGNEEYPIRPSEEQFIQKYEPELNDDDTTELPKYMNYAHFGVDKLRKLQFKNTYVFNGLVHYGLYPDHRKAYLFDKENYSILEKELGVKIGNYEDYVEYNSSITENGYKITAKFQPEALGFSSKWGLKDLQFLIDIVDIDNGNKQEALLSSSKIRKWGEPQTFNVVNVDPYIPVKLIPDIDFVGKELTKDDGYKFELSSDKIPGLFFYSDTGWIAYSQILDWYVYSDRIYRTQTPNINYVSFKKESIFYKKILIGNKKIEIYTVPEDNIPGHEKWIVYNREITKVQDIWDIFFLSDDTPVIIGEEIEYLYGECTTGYCGCAQTYSVFFTKPNQKDTIEIISSDGCSDIFYIDTLEVNILQIEDNIDEETNNFETVNNELNYELYYGKQNKFLKWKEKGKSLIFLISKTEEIEITWNEDASHIYAKRVLKN